MIGFPAIIISNYHVLLVGFIRNMDYTSQSQNESCVRTKAYGNSLRPRKEEQRKFFGEICGQGKKKNATSVIRSVSKIFDQMGGCGWEVVLTVNDTNVSTYTHT